ncbi:MAG: FAD-dependent oxidoreductase [Candidatus Omnitrophica bacterium]|nr:FAD-dependent oxidoreductase [Candidatus Omnitrophota bacterium]
MKLYKVKLLQVIDRTPTVKSFRFLPQEKIDFTPGQFLRVIFDPAFPQNKELNKYLSFSSSPADEYIEVTKRISQSAFCRKLCDLKPGDEIFIEAALGTCVFCEDYQNIAFIIGGIGITPVISILEYVAQNKLKTSITLVYSNRTEEEIAFKQELNNWRCGNPNLKVYYIVTDCQPIDKTCIFGKLSQELLAEKFPQAGTYEFFIFGPPKMVEAMKELTLGIGAKKEQIKTESFIGY